MGAVWSPRTCRNRTIGYNKISTGKGVNLEAPWILLAAISRGRDRTARTGIRLALHKSRTASPRAKRASDIKVRYRILGKTGLKVTTWASAAWSPPTAGVQRGPISASPISIRLAYTQGNNERMVGAALKGKRNSITLSSKTHSATRQEALNDLDTSLKELGTDHLISVPALQNQAGRGTDDLIDAQQTAKKAGKIRFAGVSTHAGQPVLVPWLPRTQMSMSS